MSEWNRQVEESIRQQKKKAEARSGIRFGVTEIYCARCGKSWGFNHTCQDVRFQRLQEAKKVRTPIGRRSEELMACTTP